MITLRDHATSFATRERARELFEQVPDLPRAITVDVAGVMASPSFLAQMLDDLTRRGHEVTIVGADEFQAAVISKLSQQMRIAEHVKVAELAR